MPFSPWLARSVSRPLAVGVRLGRWIRAYSRAVAPESPCSAGQAPRLAAWHFPLGNASSGRFPWKAQTATERPSLSALFYGGDRDGGCYGDRRHRVKACELRRKRIGPAQDLALSQRLQARPRESKGAHAGDASRCRAATR